MRFKLPVQPPVPPMLALLSREIPAGDEWIYEMKYDGFRAMIFWDGKQMFIQSRDLKPLNPYFPELEEKLKAHLSKPCIIDGEIVIAGADGLDFDALLLRIHPAVSRVKKLAAETPSSFIAFDLLALDGEDLMNEPLKVRRKKLESYAKSFSPHIYMSPLTAEYSVAEKWFKEFQHAIGVDGLVAKNKNGPYVPGERVMIKVKQQRTADCVVGGFRWAKEKKGIAVGSLLLGLYKGRTLHYVGHTASFKMEQRKELAKMLKEYRTTEEESGFGKGRTPGGPSRWTGDKNLSWEPVRPELVCEVSYDHMQGDRFRHATTFKRWRHDKPPQQCKYDQLAEATPVKLEKIVNLA
jgi:ATP-dependent DNA ligase